MELTETIGALIGAGGLGSVITHWITGRGQSEDRQARERRLLVEQLSGILKEERLQLASAREAHGDCLEQVNKVSAELQVLRTEHSRCPAKIQALEDTIKDHSKKLASLLSLHPSPIEPSER